MRLASWVFSRAPSRVRSLIIRYFHQQTWRTFLLNHADAIAAIDLCVVPTLTFERLFAFLVLGHGRRQLLWFAVTRIQQRNGWRNRSWQHFLGTRRQPIWYVTMMVPMGGHSCVGF